MASISAQLEELYMANSRKDMNDTLTAALMGACVTASAMPSRLMMEHILLVSILHHTVGIEVRSHLFSIHWPCHLGWPWSSMEQLRSTVTTCDGHRKEAGVKCSLSLVISPFPTGKEVLFFCCPSPFPAAALLIAIPGKFRGPHFS